MRVIALVICVLALACTSNSGGSLGGGQSWAGGGGGSGSGNGSGSGSGNGSGSGSGDGGGAWPTSAPDASQPPPQPPPMDAGTTSTACMAPADCNQGEVCCGKLDLTAMNQQCTINTFTKTCAASANCPTMVMLQCAPQQVRVCAASTDCSEMGIANCCTFGFGMKTATFCVDDTVASFATSCN